LNKEILGAGTLNFQKMVHCLAAICDEVSEYWLYFCLPGSLQSLKNLKLLQYPFDNQDQVSQVDNAVTVLLAGPPIVSKTLKEALSEAM
jgi:hypothetical protein